MGGKAKEQKPPPRRAVRWRERAHGLVDWAFGKLTWLPGVGGIILSGIGAIAIGIAGFAEFRNWRGLLLTVGIIASLTAILLLCVAEAARRRAERLASQEGADLQLAMTDAMQPALRRLTELVARPSDNHSHQLSKVISSVLTSLPILFGEKPKLRMVIFRLEAARGPRQKRLVVVDHAGRGGRHQPADFVFGDGGRGDAAFGWIETRESKFVPNIDEEDDPNWKGSGHGYKTFISAPICSDGTIYGMLTLDAPEPGDLDETDIAIVVTLASVLAVAYAARR